MDSPRGTPASPRPAVSVVPCEASWEAQEDRGGAAAAGAEEAGSPASPAALPASWPPAPLRAKTSVELASSPTESYGSFIQNAQSAPIQLGHSKSQLRRAQNRAEELRSMFQLPASEQFLDDYMCALKKKLLLQGRMYVFAEHVCFHSNLFGFQKNKAIPLAAVVEVRKRKNVGFPNSIELTLEGGKREFFTSFLAREEAFRLIMAQWRQCSEHAPPTPEPEPAAESGACRARSVSRLLQTMSLRGMSSLAQRDSCADSGRDTPESSVAGGGDGGGGGATNGGTSLGPVPEEAGSREARSSGSGRGSAAEEVELPEDSLLELMQDNSFIVCPTARTSASSGQASTAPAGASLPSDGSGGASGSGSGGGSGGQALEWQALTDLQCQKELELEVAQSEPAPPVAAGMQHVLEFDLACPPLEFWSRFLANHSDFFTRFHTARGDTGIRTSKWQRHFKVGMVRDLQFTHPVKARIGPPQTACHQTQRLTVYSGRHLVLETSQVMSDIPFGDCFRVETRWDVEPRGGGRSHVRVHLAVPFSKKTMWQRFIEKGSADDVLEATQRWRQMAGEELRVVPPTGLSPGSPEPYTEAEWNALLGRVHPNYRGAVQHLRKHSRAGSALQGGVHVGRQLPVLARHRRGPSRGEAAGRAGSGGGGGSAGGSRNASFRSLQQLKEAPEAPEQQPDQQPAPGGEEQQPPEQPRRPRGGTRGPLAGALLAAPICLLALLRRAAGLLCSRRGAAWACCVAVMAAQAAVILQQRQQLAQLQQQAAGGLLPAAQAAAGRQVAAAAANLGLDVARMQQALQVLQGQVDAALGAAADLGQRLQHSAAAGG